MCSARFDHRHINFRILRQTHLRAARRVGANRLHPQAVREDSVVANLIYLRGGQLQAGRKLADL